MRYLILLTVLLLPTLALAFGPMMWMASAPQTYAERFDSSLDGWSGAGWDWAADGYGRTTGAAATVGNGTLSKTLTLPAGNMRFWVKCNTGTASFQARVNGGDWYLVTANSSGWTQSNDIPVPGGECLIEITSGTPTNSKYVDDIEVTP